MPPDVTHAVLPAAASTDTMDDLASYLRSQLTSCSAGLSSLTTDDALSQLSRCASSAMKGSIGQSFCSQAISGVLYSAAADNASSSSNDYSVGAFLPHSPGPCVLSLCEIGRAGASCVPQLCA